MYDFEAIITEVLRDKPEISRESLMEKIQEKKRTVGSGYLTDQGALFLIAGELGVKLQHMITADLTLKDIQIGANDITVVARVLAVYPISEFKRKDGSGTGRYRRLGLFDRNGVARMTIWEDNEEAMKLDGIALDTPVRLVGAYVKQGLDGKPNLNLGKRGKVEIIRDPTVASKLTPLSALARGPEQVEEGEVVAAVEGLVAADSRRSTFVRKDDGSNGSLVQFELSSGGKTTRVVIWDGSEQTEAKSGSRVRVTNLRGKKGRQGDSELHGDGGSAIQVLEASQGRVEPVPKLVKVSEVAKNPALGTVTLEVIALSKGSVREVSLKEGGTAKKGEVVVGDDTGEITMVAWDEASKAIGDIQPGEKLRIRGAKIQVSKMGVETLELGGSSKIERLPGKT